MTVRLGGGVKGALVEICRETVSGRGSFFTVFVHSAVNRLWRPKVGEKETVKDNRVPKWGKKGSEINTVDDFHHVVI